MKNHPNAALRAIIIDDEPDARATLRLFLTKHPEVQVMAEASDVPSGIAAIRAHTPDIVFLDIQMGNKTGFDLLATFAAPLFQVVFCTGFDQFALQAIKKNALDYILKPIDPNDLAIAIQKAGKTKRNQKIARLAVQNSGEVYFLDPCNICHIESDGMYTTIRLADGKKYVQVRSLREYESMLPPDNFIRTHQSYLVNIGFVVKFRADTQLLQMKNGMEIPVARRRKTEVQLALGL